MDRWKRFWAWVDSERQRRDLNWNDMERLGGVTESALHGRFKGVKPLTTFKQAQAIATGLDIDLADVLFQAEILNPIDGVGPSVRGATEMLSRLTEDERRELIDYARFRFGLSLSPDKDA